MLAFLNCHFLFFILFFPPHHLSSIRFFFYFFFFLIFSPPHTYPIPFLCLSSFSFQFIPYHFFNYLSLSLSLSLFLQLSLFLLFLFLLDSKTLSPSISHKQILSHTHIDHQQRNGNRSTHIDVLFFFFFFYCSDFIRLMRKIAFVFQIFQLGFWGEQWVFLSKKQIQSI